MLLEIDIKKLSRSLNLPVDFVRQEIEEQDKFVSKIYIFETEVDIVMVERIMSEYIIRSELAVVPYVKNRYLYEAAVTGAVYIYMHDDDWKSGILPSFYETALSYAHAALMANDSFDELLVYSMLKLYQLKDIQAIIECMKEVNKYVRRSKKHSRYFVSKYKESQLYKLYEVVCMQACGVIAFDKSFNINERIRLIKHLTKNKNKQFLLRIYFMLYRLYGAKANLDKSGYDRERNSKTGYTFEEEYLEKAYKVLGCSLENLDLNTFSHRIWLRVAVDYATAICLNRKDLIPYNINEAERILRYAAQVEVEDIAHIANDSLQEFFKE